MIMHKLTAFTAAALLTLTAVNAPAEREVSCQAAPHQEVWYRDMDPSFNGGEPIRGVDVSSVISLEKAGVKFYNENGQEQDIFRTLSDHGVNYIRVRIWNEPNDGQGHTYGGGNCDLENAKLIAKRAAKYGMKMLVDIHYSDFWADPSRQTRPKYWAEHDHEKLKGEIYKWTTWVVKSIAETGAEIGMVQVGNETSCLFCGEDDMYKICDLFSSANKAIRDFDRNILIAHHFPNPASGHYEWYAKVMDECQLDYDVFATSYYPYWHGDLENLTSVLKTIGDRYNKYVMVAETAYPYTNEEGDAYHNDVSAANDSLPFAYDISVDGQAQCLTDVFRAVSQTGKHGLGVFYWEPAWLGLPDLSYEEQKRLWNEAGIGWTSDYAAGYDKNVISAGGSGFDNQAMFDFYGKPLASLDVFDSIYPQKKNDKRRHDGDIDGDGLVNGFDLTLLRITVLEGGFSKAADFNRDGNVNVADVVSLNRFILGKNK
ncbi:MAG TPA: glycosyl hydrolase 53 family protein [Ruminococcus sp.]|nr:glycosyl hydrolase 53 family protein [Ruminococcus sp.]